MSWNRGYSHSSKIPRQIDTNCYGWVELEVLNLIHFEYHATVTHETNYCNYFQTIWEMLLHLRWGGPDDVEVPAAVVAGQLAAAAGRSCRPEPRLRFERTRPAAHFLHAAVGECVNLKISLVSEMTIELACVEPFGVTILSNLLAFFKTPWNVSKQWKGA